MQRRQHVVEADAKRSPGVFVVWAYLQLTGREDAADVRPTTNGECEQPCR